MTTVGTVGTTISLAEAQKKTETKTAAEDSLGADAFLELLLTQLKNQDPLEPLKESEMISQMAQLNTVQSLKDLQSTMEESGRANQLLSGSEMIGKEISYKNSSDTEVSAVVSSVIVDDDIVYVQTKEGESVKLSDILSVQEA